MLKVNKLRSRHHFNLCFCFLHSISAMVNKYTPQDNELCKCNTHCSRDSKLMGFLWNNAPLIMVIMENKWQRWKCANKLKHSLKAKFHQELSTIFFKVDFSTFVSSCSHEMYSQKIMYCWLSDLRFLRKGSGWQRGSDHQIRLQWISVTSFSISLSNVEDASKQGSQMKRRLS
jgi:hypothetical protein